MLRKILVLMILGVVLINFVGCSDDEEESNGNISPSFLVLNGLAYTLSVINADYTLGNDVAVVGVYPNDFVIDEENQQIYVVNSGDNNVQVIDANSSEFATVDYIDIGVGSNPYSIALIDGDQAIVSKLMTNSVALINLTEISVVDTLAVGSAPEGIAVKDGMAYVANSAYGLGNGTVSVVNIADWSVEHTIEVGINPQQLFFDSENELNVICTGDYGETRGKIYVIDISDNSVKTSFDIGGYPAYYAVSPNGVAYIGASGGWPEGESGYIMSYDTITEEVLHGEADPILQEVGIFGLEVHPETHNLWACNFNQDKIYEIDPDENTILRELNAGDGPQLIRCWNK